MFYIEPEDDITDIISKIQNAKQKIVALVPPQKIGALRSAVNIKLIAKTASEAKKFAVIITTDASLTKAALNANLPVAVNLKSRPILPNSARAQESLTKAIPDDSSSKDAQPEDTDKSDAPAKVSAKTKKVAVEKVIDSSELEEDDVDVDTEIKEPKLAKVPDLRRHRKFIIAGILLLVLLGGFATWATVFVTSAKITVSVRTTANNFSEQVSFTTKPEEERIKEGVFLLEEQKLVKTSEVKFPATGQKNIGERAHGTISVSYNFSPAEILKKEVVSIPAGTKFYYNDLEYVSTNAVGLTATTEDVSVKPDGKQGCENQAGFFNPTCKKSATINIASVEPGEKYNTNEHTNGWTSNDGRIIINGGTAVSGGTDKIVNTVQESDITKAKEMLASVNESEGKDALLKKIPSNNIPIENTFKLEKGDPESDPKVGEEVKEGTEPTLKSESNFTIYAIDSTRVKEYIEAKSQENMADDQKVYSVGDPFIERFARDESQKFYALAKIKTTTETGPRITEQDILEKARNRKINEVKTLLKSINGVSTVEVEVPYFWVHAVPGDDNKIQIELKVER